MRQEYYLGIMSGTSLDGVDIALMAFAEQPQFIVGQFTPMPTDLRQDLLQLVSEGSTTLQQLGELDQRLALLYADCVNRFLAFNRITSALSAATDKPCGTRRRAIFRSPCS